MLSQIIHSSIQKLIYNLILNSLSIMPFDGFLNLYTSLNFNALINALFFVMVFNLIFLENDITWLLLIIILVKLGYERLLISYNVKNIYNNISIAKGLLPPKITKVYLCITISLHTSHNMDLWYFVNNIVTLWGCI